MATTSTLPNEYDKKVFMTIPHYIDIHFTVLDLVRHSCPSPATWLDIGCGTGKLTEDAAGLFPDTLFTVCDPSPEMLALAKERLHSIPTRFIEGGAQELSLPQKSQDVVTAVLSLHYIPLQERESVANSIFEMLRSGGVYIQCEHTAPRTEYGKTLTLSRWEEYQHSAGKTAEAAAAHVARYNKSYFPMSLERHIELLERCGFENVELAWASYCDTIIWARKK